MKWLYASVANLIAACLLPILLIQGKLTRRDTPRLPEAHGARQGLVRSTKNVPLQLLVLGESPVAGVGVANQSEGIASRFAQALAQQGHTVAWQAIGKNGATLAQAQQQLLPKIPLQPQDIVLVAFGVNDTSAFRGVLTYELQLRQMLLQIMKHCQPRLLLLAAVPPVGHLPALPQPLRMVLGLKASSLDHASRDVARKLQQEGHTAIHYVPLGVDLGDTSLLAIDGFHPSAKRCEVWAQNLARDALVRM